MVNLPAEYSDKPATPFGGMAIMKRFLDQVGIREKLGRLDVPSPGSNRDYSSEQILNCLKARALKVGSVCEPVCLEATGASTQRSG